MHDAVLCAEAGVPSVVVVTDPFERLARLTLQNFGVPEFPVLVVEHPLFTRDTAWMQHTANRLGDEIVAGAIAAIAESSASVAGDAGARP